MPARHQGIAADARQRAYETAFLPVDWLVAALFALMHAAVDEVRATRLDPTEAPNTLSSTLHRLFVAG